VTGCIGAVDRLCVDPHKTKFVLRKHKMKRDIDLIRKIAFEVESLSSPINSESLRIDGFNTSQISYHCELMIEAGLIVGKDTSPLISDFASFKIQRLTSKGHDFIDAARSDSIWNQAKEKIATTVGSTSIDIITRFLKTLASSALGLPAEP
jgi:hypothetical protein